MEYRRLGKSGLKVSALSMGTFCLFNKGNEETAYAVFERCLKAGVNFFDGAETYGQTRGDCERTLGDFLKRANVNRQDVIISTKIFWGGDSPTSRGLSRKHIIEGVDAALQRMQLDHVDLVYCHRPDPDTPIEETCRAMNQVINSGKAFYWGTSMWSAQQLTEAYAICKEFNLVPPTMEQPEYNLLARERVEQEYAPLYPLLGLGITSYSPLASGLLSGKYSGGNIPADSRFGKLDWIKKSKYDQVPDMPLVLAKIDKVAELAQSRLGCSVSELCLAWCLKNPRISSVIMGVSSVAQLDSNLNALTILPKLSEEIMKEIDAIMKM